MSSTQPTINWKRRWFSNTMRAELDFNSPLKNLTPKLAGKLLLKALPQLAEILNSQDRHFINCRGVSQTGQPGELVVLARGKLSDPEAKSASDDDDKKPLDVFYALRSEFESFLPNKDISYHRITEVSEELQIREPWLNFERLFNLQDLEIEEFVIQFQFLKKRSFGDFLGLAPVLFRDLAIVCRGSELRVTASEEDLSENVPPFSDWNLPEGLNSVATATSSHLN